MDILQDPQYRTADGSALRIWRDAALNNFASEREGRPIFDDCIFAEVISPGSRDSTPVFELVRKFAPEANHPEPKYGIKYVELKEYVKSFESDEETEKSLTGTPLSQWSEVNRTMQAQLRAQNIYTVDALASLPDTKLTLVGPDGRTWRAKAQAYLDNAAGTAQATALAAMVEQMKADSTAKDEQIAALAAQIAALQAAQTPAPVAGRRGAATPPEPAPEPAAAPII
jgi:hypothetical protein